MQPPRPLVPILLYHTNKCLQFNCIGKSPKIHDTLYFLCIGYNNLPGDYIY